MGVGDVGRQLVLADGVHVEVVGDPAADALIAAGNMSGIAQTAEDELVGGVGRKVVALTDGLTGTIRTFCESVQDSVSELRCAEVTVEFGVAVKAGVDIPYLVTGAGEANVKVTAKWTNRTS